MQDLLIDWMYVWSKRRIESSYNLDEKMKNHLQSYHSETVIVNLIFYPFYPVLYGCTLLKFNNEMGTFYS